MKLLAMLLDDNGRARASFVDIKMNRVSDTEAVSEKQDGTIWRIGYRTNLSPHVRTDGRFERSLMNAYEQQVGGSPHFVGLMNGHAEITMQNGDAWRLSAGDFLYVCPGALHHSNFPSLVPGVMFNLYMPGTDTDTGPYPFK